jgi:hypothetical protein
VKEKSHPNRIRFDFPAVDYRSSTDNYWVDARQHEYPGKKSGEYLLRDRDKAFARA